MTSPEKKYNRTINSSNEPANQHILKKKPARKGWLFILIALVAITFIILKDARRSINWIDDYQHALRQSDQKDMPLLLAFVSPSSADSQKLDKYTYAELKVIKYINRSFLPVRINVDQDQTLARKFDISKFPTHLIINHQADMENLHTIPGYIAAGEFIGRLKRARQRALESTTKK